MKNIKTFAFIFAIISLLITPTLVSADNEGGTGSGGGGSGGTGGTVNQPFDPGHTVDSGAYLFEFVYKPKNNDNRQVLSCAVVVVNPNPKRATFVRNEAKDYAKKHCDGRYYESGSMANLASNLNKGKYVDDIFNKKQLEDQKLILKYMNELGVKSKDLTKEHDYNTGHINSYGYRILIQHFTLFVKGSNFSAASLKLRKQAAANGSMGAQYLFGGAGNRAKDLWTTKGDIGIKASGLSQSKFTSLSSEALTKKFADKNDGSGYQILWMAFKKAAVNDYSVDAACVGCDDNEKNKDRASYIIQDTSDWQAIFDSTDDDSICAEATAGQKNNVKKYYKKMSCGKNAIYCREEVKVVFPNSNNTPTVQNGRYFTVHSPFRNINKDNQVIETNAYGEKVTGYDDVIKILNDNKYNHNWGDIKIIKTRECRMKNTSSEKSCLESNKNNLKFKQEPNVQLTYRGNSDNKTDADKVYEEELTNVELAKEDEKEFGSSTKQVTSVTASKYTSEDKSATSNYVFRDVQTTSYKLPDDKVKNKKGNKLGFRYVLKDSGVFVTKQPSGGKGDDKNFSPNSSQYGYIDLGIATIPVSPNNTVYTENDGTISLKFTLDKDMHLSKSFTKDNNYLPTCTTKADKDDSPNIYNFVTAKGKISKTSVSGITDAKKRNQLINSSCSKLYLCSGTKNGITCKKSGVDTCIKNRTVNKIGNTAGTNCYVKSRGESGNDYACKIEAEPDIPDIPDIPVPDCPGCVEPDPGFKVPDPDPDAPATCVKEINGVCVPATGNGNIIYRTIDLSNPFPGRSGSNRYSGLNWCQYDQDKNKFSCYWNEKNEVVDTYILNNRGVKGDSVYNLTPMYTVELDGQTIKNIKSYNSGTSYDDFNLNCNIKGQECISRFVDSYATKNCNNFGSCDGA